GIYNATRVTYGTPQTYVTPVSVRKLLGINGSRTDSVTGQTLSEGDQFRGLLLKNDNMDGRGGVAITFATDLQPGNGLWATDVCSDRLSGIPAQLVGDFLGDNEAQLNLTLDGGSIMRNCDSDSLTTWSIASNSSASTAAFSVLQAGVNTWGDAPANTSFFGQAVARPTWRVTIPGGGDAPADSDIDLTHVDDIMLRFTHTALPRRSGALSVDASCLAQIGGGQ
ncbi:MAG TPA: hypothetical protein VNO21_09025, partial [Polyangiaceae bacterium]|nr:hypothetical protein [Polyangiaceae bacterium]